MPAIDVLKKLGCEVREISLPHTHYAVACYYVIATAEASSNLARFDGVRYTVALGVSGNADGDVPASRATKVSAPSASAASCWEPTCSARGYYDAYYLKAQKVRALVARDYAQAFEQVDAIVGPVSPFPAFKLGEKVDDPVAMYLSDIYTITGDLAGIPCMSVPCGNTREGLAGGTADFHAAFRRNGNVPSGRCVSRRASDIVEST